MSVFQDYQTCQDLTLTKREIIKISVSLLMALIVVSLIFITQQTDGLSSISDFYLKADKLTGGKIL